MDVLILSAGRGQRLRPITDKLPKPLIRVGQRRLIEHHLVKLASIGLKNIIINTAYHAEMIERILSSGEKYGLRIRYSREREGALETGGGIKHALPLIKTNPFLVINCDVLTDIDFAALRREHPLPIHLLLVPNPDHHPGGDFGLSATGLVTHPLKKTPSYTYAGVGVYRQEVFLDQPIAKFALAPLLRDHIDQQQVSGEVHRGLWLDVGTAQRLERARALFKELPCKTKKTYTKRGTCIIENH